MCYLVKWLSPAFLGVWGSYSWQVLALFFKHLAPVSDSTGCYLPYL